MIAFIAGVIAGIIAGIYIAPHVYLWHAELVGLWPPKEPEQGREHAP